MRPLWINSLTREAIRAAFDRLRPLSDYDALYAAARCRNEADWVVGLNATRYYTVRYRAADLFWSVGPDFARKRVGVVGPTRAGLIRYAQCRR